MDVPQIFADGLCLRRGRGWRHRWSAGYLAPVTGAVDRKPPEIPALGFFQNLMVVEGVASGRKYL
jgi:hypothetical protein